MSKKQKPKKVFTFRLDEKQMGELAKDNIDVTKAVQDTVLKLYKTKLGKCPACGQALPKRAKKKKQPVTK